MQPLFNSYDNKISELMNENKSNKVIKYLKFSLYL